MKKLLSSGIKELDKMLNGIQAGALITLIGPAGAGKSALALQFLKEGMRAGEGTLFISVSFNHQAAAEKIKKDLPGKSGQLFHSAGYNPSSNLNKAEMAALRKLLHSGRTKRAVIDCAMSNATGQKAGIVPEIARVIRDKNITTMLVQRGGADISSLENHYFLVDPDVVIFMTFFEYYGSLGRCISVLKNQGRRHEHAIKEVRMKGSDLSIMEQAQVNTGIIDAASRKNARGKPQTNTVDAGGEPVLRKLTAVYNTGKSGKGQLRQLYKYHIQTSEDFRRLSPGTGLVYVYSELFNEIYSMGLLADLSDALPELVRSSLVPKAYLPFTRNGAVFGVAKNLELNLLFYRTDLLKKYKLAVPENLEELARAASLISGKESDIDGLTFVDTAFESKVNSRSMLQYVLNSGASIADPLYKTAGSRAAVNAMGYIRKMISSGAVPKTFLDPKERWDGINRFMSGKAAFIHATSDMFRTLEGARSRIRIGKDAGFMILPGARTYSNQPIAQSSVFVIPAISKNKQQAKEFLSFIITKGPKSQAEADYPFPPQLEPYSDPAVLKRNAYYADIPEFFEKSVCMEEIPGIEKGFRSFYREIMFAITGKKTPEQAAETAMRLVRAVSAEERVLPGKLKAALAFIRENFSRKFRLSGIAEAAGLSQNHFNAAFLKTTGFTAMDYLAHFRALKAIELLDDHSLNISEAGYKCGYPDPLHFSAAFKRITGFSPEKFRKFSADISEKYFD